MKKNLIILFTALAISSVSFAQTKIKGNGILGTENRNTPTYDQITLIGSTTIELINGSEGNLIVSGETNLLSYVETQVVGNELIVKFKNGTSFTTKKDLKVIVPIKDVSKISLKGSGDIIGKEKFNLKNIDLTVNGSGDLNIDVDSENVIAEVFGSGDIEIKGNTNNFKALVKGSGDINAKKLQSQISDLTVNGSGDIESTTLSQLKANVFGSGDINVSGSPSKVSKSVKGSGDISIK